jgi:histidine triad (HIT) family protein
MADCIFCKIANKEIPASVVYEDNDSIAFLDINPVAKGHTLVIPKKHFETIKEIEGDNLAKVMGAVKKIAEALLKKNEGINVMQNNNSAAGQIVPHLHFHVIPRNKGDGLKFNWPSKKLNENEFKEAQEEIKNLLKP